MRIPYAIRARANEYKTVAKVIADDTYLEMTDTQFVNQCLKASGGHLNPARIRQIYFELMRDAGLTALSSPMKSEQEDNGDHSWEYYVDGKVLKDEDFNQAHTTYFTA